MGAIYSKPVYFDANAPYETRLVEFVSKPSESFVVKNTDGISLLDYNGTDIFSDFLDYLANATGLTNPISFQYGIFPLYTVYASANDPSAKSGNKVATPNFVDFLKQIQKQLNKVGENPRLKVLKREVLDDILNLAKESLADVLNSKNLEHLDQLALDALNEFKNLKGAKTSVVGAYYFNDPMYGDGIRATVGRFISQISKVVANANYNLFIETLFKSWLIGKPPTDATLAYAILDLVYRNYRQQLDNIGAETNIDGVILTPKSTLPKLLETIDAIYPYDEDIVKEQFEKVQKVIDGYKELPFVNPRHIEGWDETFAKLQQVYNNLKGKLDDKTLFANIYGVYFNTVAQVLLDDAEFFGYTPYVLEKFVNLSEKFMEFLGLPFVFPNRVYTWAGVTGLENPRFVQEYFTLSEIKDVLVKSNNSKYRLFVYLRTPAVNHVWLDTGAFITSFILDMEDLNPPDRVSACRAFVGFLKNSFENVAGVFKPRIRQLSLLATDQIALEHFVATIANNLEPEKFFKALLDNQKQTLEMLKDVVVKIVETNTQYVMTDTYNGQPIGDYIVLKPNTELPKETNPFEFSCYLCGGISLFGYAFSTNLGLHKEIKTPAFFGLLSLLV